MIDPSGLESEDYGYYGTFSRNWSSEWSSLYSQNHPGGGGSGNDGDSYGSSAPRSSEEKRAEAQQKQSDFINSGGNYKNYYNDYQGGHLQNISSYRNNSLFSPNFKINSTVGLSIGRSGSFSFTSTPAGLCWMPNLASSSSGGKVQTYDTESQQFKNLDRSLSNFNSMVLNVARSNLGQQYVVGENDCDIWVQSVLNKA